MRMARVGEFQELVLMAIIVLQDEAHGNEIQRELEDRLKERISVGAVQTALKRMEQKGLVTSEWGEATQKRGGKRKLIYAATPYAHQVLRDMKDVRIGFWEAIANLGTSHG
ncbi:MAG TPA: PadR family transcriptional regulator [Cytophagales bacterium]|nr:PadR family transcriptional regulator [Cytophagales bacterium]